MKEVKSLLFFLLSIPTFIFGQVVTDGLILNLDTRDSNSYSGSGNTWNDISGNNYNATIIGGTSYSNNQFTLDGSNNYIKTPAIPFVGVSTQDYSLEVIVLSLIHI